MAGIIKRILQPIKGDPAREGSTNEIVVNSPPKRKGKK